MLSLFLFRRARARRRALAAPLARRPHDAFPACDAAQADFDLLAAGLQRLLAKWPPEVTARHFPAARRACKALQMQGRVQAELGLPAQLLSDLCHEIAVHVEPPVRQAAVRCLRRQAAAPRAVRATLAA
jgi:hypothetical protein